MVEPSQKSVAAIAASTTGPVRDELPGSVGRGWSPQAARARAADSRAAAVRRVMVRLLSGSWARGNTVPATDPAGLRHSPRGWSQRALSWDTFTKPRDDHARR